VEENKLENFPPVFFLKRARLEQSRILIVLLLSDIKERVIIAHGCFARDSGYGTMRCL
jgi:hypothetical protein